MNEEKLKRANEISREIESLKAQSANLSSNVYQREKEVTISKIQKEVTSYYGITLEELNGRRRIQTIVLPRHIAMYLSRELTDASFPKIGSELCG